MVETLYSEVIYNICLTYIIKFILIINQLMQNLNFNYVLPDLSIRLLGLGGLYYHLNFYHG